MWIDYFRGGPTGERLDALIDENLILTNDLILAELIPFLKMRNQKTIIELLGALKKLTLSIDWEQISDYQYQCLRHGINGVRIPDLIIAQNCAQNRCKLFTIDNHFNLMHRVIDIDLEGNR